MWTKRGAFAYAGPAHRRGKNVMVEYQGAEANTVGTNAGSAGFSLWRAIVYGLALSGLAYALNAVQHASPEQIAYVLGYLGVGPVIFVTIGAFLNLSPAER
jgi:hypothetical protein